MLNLQGVSFTHPNGDQLFSSLNLVVNNHEKIALIGNNGTGKSTLLRIISGSLPASHGLVRIDTKPYLVPQLTGQFKLLTVAQALGISDKLEALQSILEGQVTLENMAVLNDDWNIEERCKEAFSYWDLTGVSLSQNMGALSGGQKTKVFLAGIQVHRPGLVLMDEPSNHLDLDSRLILNRYITSTNDTLVIVSHDRTLLNLVNEVAELNADGIRVYGGNFDFYLEQKMIAETSASEELKAMEKALRKAKETERESVERQQKLDARGKRKQEKAGLPTISMNTFRNNAERSSSRIKQIHEQKVKGLSQNLQDLRNELPMMDQMKVGFQDAQLHRGKVLVNAEAINHRFNDRWLWREPLNLQLNSGDRVAIAGANGTGKTTLIKLLLGDLEPTEGRIERATFDAIYLDQDYSITNNDLSVYEQAERFNPGLLQDHEIRLRLHRFLFEKADWDKPCSMLSGGEKMRLTLCCLSIGNKSPDLIVLDEPTNNLDIQNIRILKQAITEYKGTLVVVSHDDLLLKEINLDREIVLS